MAYSLEAMGGFVTLNSGLMLSDSLWSYLATFFALASATDTNDECRRDIAKYCARSP